MDLGKGFPIPREKGAIQIRNNWTPSTPDKPVSQGSNCAQSEMPQNQIGKEDWNDLLGIYTGVLQNEVSNVVPQKFNLHSFVGQNNREHNIQGIAPVQTNNRLQHNIQGVAPVRSNNRVQHNIQGVAPVQTNNRVQHNIQGVAPVQNNNRLQHNFQDPNQMARLQHNFQDPNQMARLQHNFQDPNQMARLQHNFQYPTQMVRLQQSRDFAPVNTYTMLPQNFGVNLENHNIQDISTLHMFGQLNGNRGNTGSYVQISGEVPHQKVDSLTELMGMMKDASRNSPSNGSTYHVGNPTISCQHSRVESDRVAHASFGAILQQDHALCASYDGGGYNLQQMPNGKRSVPNLNLPASSEFGESSSSSRPFLLGPVTPDQQKRSNNQIIQVPDLLIDETSTREKHMQDNVVLSPQPEIIEKEQHEIVLNTGDRSTAVTSNSTKEKTICQGGDGGIDQNKTPQQKTPKRRKHRPKVIVEKKPKRTPKPAATKTDSPDGNPPAKRKYVCKSGIKTSENQSGDAVNVVETSNSEPAAKSCKRKLDFELGDGPEKENGGIDYQAQNNEGNKRPFNLNLDSHDAEWYKDLNEPMTSAAKGGQQDTCEKERQQTQPACSSAHSVNKLPVLESIPLATTAPPPTSKDRTLNVIARSLSLRNASTNPNVDGHNQVQHPIGGGLAQLVIRANTNKPDLDSRRQSAVGYMPPQLLGNPMGDMEKQQTIREYNHSEMRHPHAITLMGSQLWFHGVPWTGHCNGERVNIRQNGSEMGKTKKVEDMFHGTSSSTPSDITTIDPWGHIESWRNKSFPTQSYTVHQNGELTNSGGTGQSISRNPNDRSNMVAYDCYMNFRNKFQQHHASSAQLHLCSEQIAPKTSNNSAREQTTNPLTAITNCNLESTSKRVPKSTSVHEITNSPGRVAVKRRNVRQTPSKRILQQESKMSRSYGHSSNKVTGLQEEERRIFAVDYITDLMRDLHINNNGKKIAWKEQNALVPYRGDGAIVPFDLVKKRRPRPRVDLDPETNRVWNLLMVKEGGESSEPMDTDKQKWWEEERKIFRGRVDSFIARMHLVQGDRRFSKWKGSVVDSVIGVFLTQNVSDHLSSSAFMSLAAKFPLKSTSARQTSCGDGGTPVEHHDVRITFPDETTCDQKIIKEPVYNHSSVTSIESSECRVENVKTGTRTFPINDQTKRTEEDIISSQSSSESFVFQASEDIRSSSGSNSEAEEGWNFNKTLGYVNAVEHAERIAALQQDQFRIMGSLFPNKRPLIDHQPKENAMYRQNPGPTNGLEKWEADILAFSGNESMSSLASTDIEIIDGTGGECGHDYRVQGAKVSFSAIQNQTPKCQPDSTVDHAILHKHMELQSDFSDGSQNRNGQHLIKHRQGNQETFQQDSVSLANPTKRAETFSEQPNDNLKRNDDITLGRTETGQPHSTDKSSSKISNTTTNAKKRKPEKETAEPFDWDTLRKQVQSTTGIRPRSRGAMDSLDYEALRNADVREISDTIKERGMNNMLAERIKAFLDRVVQDHERIDLEWLRDVQPDKVKDYLLSIRGLGLKSVECVRLLTLHHLAFPVDTNVGRIAVRLGWVPLQPLPESLQLHLLELYPVLETIQKYLWPRLCKLDQETLYELHYQMITFGKVFCTKREPNCNACPMRAECRHFASAFASARLALPGLEERQIISSAAPISANKSSDIRIKPLQLLPSEDNVEKGIGLTRNCEPFVEEPTTPEPDIEVSERDIEDAFYEDPDEIPIIKLNVEEFTSNLQTFMQEQMEMGEADMSKALVALNPELASIPIPKLKHISRLRTEHQVYELPDSHPLLIDMDRREPDDPSPYLLAIWTPGETADSVQPPESTCSYQEGGGLCDRQTCFSCSSTRESQAQTVRGTILIPCRTAMRGSFPLNGTYFQVNEVFADHESSLNPIDVPRSMLWNLPRRTVFFGTSVSTIFKGLSTEGIQYCFWKGFVCVRGFDKKSRAPRPLKARLHLPASKMAKKNE